MFPPKIERNLSGAITHSDVDRVKELLENNNTKIEDADIVNAIRVDNIEVMEVLLNKIPANRLQELTANLDQLPELKYYHKTKEKSLKLNIISIAILMCKPKVLELLIKKQGGKVQDQEDALGGTYLNYVIMGVMYLIYTKKEQI